MTTPDHDLARVADTLTGDALWVACQKDAYEFERKAMTTVLQIGDHVRKVKGYAWPGIIVAVFDTLSGARHVVVECTVPEVAGALHIYNEDQLARQSSPVDVAGARAISGERERALEEALRNIKDHAAVRIKDGVEMGATVWRLALEDVVHDVDQALKGQP